MKKRGKKPHRQKVVIHRRSLRKKPRKFSITRTTHRHEGGHSQKRHSRVGMQGFIFVGFFIMAIYLFIPNYLYLIGGLLFSFIALLFDRRPRLFLSRLGFSLAILIILFSWIQKNYYVMVVGFVTLLFALFLSFLPQKERKAKKFFFRKKKEKKTIKTAKKRRFLFFFKRRAPKTKSVKKAEAPKKKKSSLFAKKVKTEAPCEHKPGKHLIQAALWILIAVLLLIIFLYYNISYGFYLSIFAFIMFLLSLVANFRVLKHKHAAIKITLPKGKTKTPYETDFDRLYYLLEKRKKLKVSEIANTFHITKKKAEQWMHIFQESELADLHYPPLGEAELAWK